MSNNTYKILKFIAQDVLPALATLIITVCHIWGLPYGAEIGATITAADAALGIILHVSTNTYKAGGGDMNA